MTEEIDYDCLSSLILEINDRIKLITTTLIPLDKEYIIKNLASASIHIALFMQDICEYKLGIKDNKDYKIINKFLQECGCKDIGIKNGT